MEIIKVFQEKSICRRLCVKSFKSQSWLLNSEPIKVDVTWSLFYRNRNDQSWWNFKSLIYNWELVCRVNERIFSSVNCLFSLKCRLNHYNSYKCIGEKTKS